ncbi:MULTISPECIES: glutamate-5-semialdehyde dehydrogenase [Rhizobium/Agrobacterium group]|uniref:Gamma-glutamyl phosphate reductase n=2 Tax=Rhizobium/Agrobacterium group TaxID=227290 RepID=PROA_ALLAM|nr:MULTISPECIES: glutamate-5-semialdehyde dehydrogenase [Rhizobium/Agrobacterium group]B9JUH7.1 RecName: Full=Gamma-glutamyl phosphate reductase; Short=GPR; AltName: Full=Glutamate-5-semialdehyde dehydrogenase; AltName: Full=Glutamyl-gamma-semialdehyde dehydrogenase; Short=GSA dehydrogenase [Allorhizobium ampelinum S4]ACM38100.1 gamma-glutamyl phosphate reductase [Allorhizobium ampelinum S4]MCF1446894.1 glutamate-5-semialdehyde dehydrogenase [Allorhizobium ampelinum]MCF1491781.1 glutamate-5-sem
MLDTVAKADGIDALMLDIGAKAKAAARPLAIASADQKNAALMAMSEAILSGKSQIIAANAIDLKAAETAGLAASFIDRLTLNEERITAMAKGLREVAELKDPVSEVIAAWERPNGLKIERVRTPLGVIGVIYESRPNVTADAGALCLKSGNAVILRGGSDSVNSSRAIHACLVAGLVAAGLPDHAIQLVPVTDRAAVGAMLTGLNGTIDVIVPRGGKSLVARVQSDARVPVFAHLEGLCHVYVDGSADLDMAKSIVVNAKMRRTGICGSAETLLVDSAAIGSHLMPLLEALTEAGCEIRASATVLKVFPGLKAAVDEDWRTEYLDAIISVAVVDGIGGAIDHIARYSSNHTEAVIAEDPAVVERFFNEVDSAILLHNASTQFADGGEFGMGGEIGIATGKMHARGPVGVEQLTSFKYRVHGTGQIRP